MELRRVTAIAARLLHQLRVSPCAVAQAAAWRGFRRPWLRWRQALGRRNSSSGPGAVIRSDLGWARALLQTATIPPLPVTTRIMRSPCTVFGRCWSSSAETLGSIDPRFGVEAWRMQHLQALAAVHWQAADDHAASEVLDRTLPEPLAVFLLRALEDLVRPLAGASPGTPFRIDSGIRPYPMDHGLRILTALVVYTALQGRAGTGLAQAVDDNVQTALAAAVHHTIDLCLSDPEYSGSLSNNHHLTTVVCLLVMLSSISSDGDHRSAICADQRWTVARNWLLRALDEQFDVDGVHFEYSTGYHMCTLELLALASLVIVDSSDPGGAPVADFSPCQRWVRLEAACPPLAKRLTGALQFADCITRSDGTYPLIGDFDASRILRTHVSYRNTPETRIGGDGDDGYVERYRTEPMFGTATVTASPIERSNAADAARMTRALFGLPHIAASTSHATKRKEPAGACSRPAIFKRRATALEEPTVHPRVSTTVHWKDRELLRSVLGAAASDMRSCVRYEFPVPPTGEQLRIRHFQAAGILVARTNDLLVTLRSGKPGQRGIGTHSHLDCLASDVWIAKGAKVFDPGSWCYGASMERRNRYRANSGHFTPLWQLDCSGSLRHPFFIGRSPPCATLMHDNSACWGVVESGQEWTCRFVTLRRDQLLILDASSGPDLKPVPLHDLPPLADGYFGPLVRELQPQEKTVCAA